LVDDVVVCSDTVSLAHEATKSARTAAISRLFLNTSGVSLPWRRQPLRSVDPSSEGQTACRFGGDLTCLSRRITVAGQRRVLTGLRSETAPG
jgi:hypothetical protein